MRITLQLDDQLVAEVMSFAAETDKSFTQVIEDALRMALVYRIEHEKREPRALHTCGGMGLQPGVNLKRNAALEDLMDDLCRRAGDS